MKAMILAAGRGKRMKPLSDHTPKPLLEVKGKALIVYHLENFASSGIHTVVINVWHLGKKLKDILGDGSRWGLKIHYSNEEELLETGGGIVKALPWLGPDPFLVVSGDILTSFPFQNLPKEPKGLAHLVLTDNPPCNLKGDYFLKGDKVMEKSEHGEPLLNFGGIGVYRPELFKEAPEGPFRLPELFKKAFENSAVTGEHFTGMWHNIGTPEQLEMINQMPISELFKDTSGNK